MRVLSTKQGAQCINWTTTVTKKKSSQERFAWIVQSESEKVFKNMGLSLVVLTL